MTTPPPFPQQPAPKGFIQAPDGSWHPVPKKKHTIRNIVLGIIIAFVLIVGGCMAMVGGAAKSVDNQIHKNDGKAVVYEISSDSGTASNVTYSINNGQQQETDVTTPWSKQWSTDTSGFQSFVLSASNGIDGGSGAISCKITVDGKVVANQTSNGQYANVTCSAS